MLEQRLENLDQRLARVEQILRTLVTKEDLKTLATKEDLNTLATREELQELRRHMDVLNESLRGDIHLIAAHVASQRSKDAGT